ncbi:hypothetical protein PIB30_012611 [Stylosanthes scabra]|uniref:Formin-like protein n=1 Tax=Stylosanthes scabra TaxID=79078 RepID=A0ABU6Y4Z7_9FABA|nr:hypothetical protein [Stylosanthes scabra]
MKTHHWSSFFFILSLEFWSLLLFFPSAKALNAFQLLSQNASTKSNSRRILHQPLFPAASAPVALPPPPPTPDTPSSPDIPFFNENPPGPPPADLNQQPAAATANGGIANPTATQPAKPVKTVAIVVSVAFVTFAMLFVLAFFLYKQTAKQQPPETTQKLVAAESRNDLPTAAPPSSLYYIGTVDPSRVSVSEPSEEATASEMNRSSSSYRKLNSKKVSERYRPSPELQPLPPLSKTVADGSHPPPAASSSSSSDDEEDSRETAFHSPQASSSLSIDDGYHTPVSRHSYFSNGSNSSAAAPPPVPFSKRTSPKSRNSASSDTKLAMIIPPIKHAPQQESISGPSRRPRFAAPPPAPNLTHIHSNMSTNSINPPPPPPPPPPPRKVRSQAINLTSSSSSSSSASRMQQESWSGSQVAASAAKSIAKASEEFNKMKRVASSEKLKSSSFQLNEGMMESLFGCGGGSSAPKETVTRKSVIPTVEHENRVLDPKKSQNIAIMLRALNVTRDEVSEALLDGNPEGLGAELLETLVKMAPTKEEEIKLKSYDAGLPKLGSAERFLKTVLDIPFAFKRVEAMLYRANFDTEVNYLRKSFQTLETASEELKNSRLFLKLLEAVLRTGNRMNVGTYRGDATAFKLDTLLKLVDIKGTDRKTTLLHFVVQEIIRTKGSTGESSNENVPTEMNSQFNDEEFRKKGLQVVAGLSRDLGNVKKSAGMDSEVLSSYVSKLESGLDKVRLILQHEKPDMQENFFNSMKLFLKEAEAKIVMIKSDERKALFLVKEVTEYFHGNTAKEEAHPFRIFMIVRDFLNILDQVCKEVGKMQERTVIGSARSFRIAASASLPVLNRYRTRQDTTSSEEDSSSP